MSTTTDGTQLSPCVKLFIDLLLDGASAVTSREVAIVHQPQDVVTHFRTVLPPNALVPESANHIENPTENPPLQNVIVRD
ncbi:MAG TPA: hypothetical protein VMU26_05730 [Candidatus Polarisedimenticolia bacterium]|nr:hypothetical protein [Candidatus Polarisedimenticolia bacterium]